MKDTPLVAPSVRLYAVLLRLAPRSLRRARSVEMTELFHDIYVAAYAEDGWRGIVRAWFDALRGLIGTALFGRTMQRGMPPRRGTDSLRSRLLADLRMAMRTLRRAPGFAAVAILTLGLGLGATTAIFSVVYGVVVRPLPYDDAHDLVYLDHGAPGLGFDGELGIAAGLFDYYRPRQSVFEAMGYWQDYEVTVTAEEAPPERVLATEATAGVLTALRIRPQVGRLFDLEDDLPDGPRTVLLEYGFWQRRFAGDPEIVGESLTVSGDSFEIIGVLPAGFALTNADLFLDNRFDGANRFGGYSHRALARLRPGATLLSARRQLNDLLAQVEEDTFAVAEVKDLLDEARTAAQPVGLKEWIVGPVEQTLWILMGTVSFVLLTACANVANLFLVRSEARQRETAVRLALGASAGQLLRTFVSESVLVAAAGGSVGAVLAHVAVRAMVASVPFSVPRLSEVSIDGTVLAFVALATVAIGLLFGTFPVLRRMRDVGEVLRDGGRGTTVAAPRLRARQALVVAQIALSLMLLAGAGLTARSFTRLLRTDPGFEAANVLTFRLALPASDYPDDSAAAAFHIALLESVRSLPGVVSAGAVRDLPLSGFSGGELMVEEQDPPREGEMPPVAWVNRVTEEYFESLRIPLIRGRPLERRDLDGDLANILISEAAVATFFPDVDPVGQRVSFGLGGDPTWLTIVGIVGDVKQGSLTEIAQPMVYLTMRQGNFNSAHRMSYAVRTTVPPTSILGAVREAAGALDRQVPLIQPRSLASVVQEAGAPAAFTLLVLGVAALVGLALGAVGVYGVVAYVVRQRTGEIGVRMALGATGANVQRMLLRQSAYLAVLGLVIGLVGTLLLANSLAAVLYGVGPFDPLTHATTIVALLGAVLLATWVPARRAARIDPVEALRAN